MAKKAGPKEAALRAMRESKAEGLVDKHALQEARAAARKKADEVFEHEMEKITKPLDAQLEALRAKETSLESELETVQGDIIKLTKARNDVLGIESGPSKAGGGKKKKADELATIANGIAEFIKRQPEPIAAGAIKVFLNQFHGGYKVQLPMKFLNTHAPGHGVKATGEKSATRYH